MVNDKFDLKKLKLILTRLNREVRQFCKMMMWLYMGRLKYFNWFM